MQRILLSTVLSICVFLSVNEKSSAATDGVPIKIAAGFSMEPYMLKSGEGILGDIITESFGDAGVDVEFSFHSNIEAIELFNKNDVDAVSVVKAGMVVGKYSQPIVTFSNRVISLTSSDVVVEDISDLGKYRIIAFSNARKYLGSAFSDAADKAPAYSEIPFQELQVKALFDGDADIIVADKTIYQYYWKKLRNKTPQDKKWHQKAVMGYTFSDNVYHIAFHSEEHQRSFDRGFEKLISSGRYQEILNTYLGLLEQY